MNILLVSAIYPEPVDYSIRKDSSAVHYFTREWVKLGHNVKVIHIYMNPIKKIFDFGIRRRTSFNTNEGVDVSYFFNQLYIPRYNAPTKMQQYFLARLVSRTMRKKHSGFNPDLCLVHFPMSYLYFCKCFFKPYSAPVAIFHGSDLRYLEQKNNSAKLINDISITFRKNLFRSLDLVNRAKQIGINIPDNPVVYSGIDANLIADIGAVETKLSLMNKKLKIVYAGHLNPQKNVETIIKAISLCNSDIVLDIIGDGVSEPVLKSLVNKLDLNDKVNFCGRITREEVVEKMRNSDVFVMVSTNETLGLVYLEAMAQGCISIGTRGEGIDGIILDDVNGILVSPFDVNELARKIDGIAGTNIDDRRVLATNGYLTAKDMTANQMAADYLSRVSI